MYLPRHFAETDPARLHALVRAHPLGTLITQGADGQPVADLLPFELCVQADGSACLRTHVARANPLWRAHPAGQPVLVLFQGGDAYVSPSAYPSKHENGKAVPTWNYTLVQARGPLRVIDGDAAWLRAFLHALTQRHEAAQAAPWRLDDAPAAYIDAMLAAVVGLEVAVTTLQGKFKLSQNQPPANRQGVHDALAALGHPLADAMARQAAHAACQTAA